MLRPFLSVFFCLSVFGCRNIAGFFYLVMVFGLFRKKKRNVKLKKKRSLLKPWKVRYESKSHFWNRGKPKRLVLKRHPILFWKKRYVEE